MAKVSEGTPYYYSPHRYSSEMFKIEDKRKTGDDPIAEGVTQDNASLIVDALNACYHLHPKRHDWDSIDKDNMEYQLRTTCYVKDMISATEK